MTSRSWCGRTAPNNWRATGCASNIHEPFGLILVGVKSYSLDEAMDQFAPAVGPHTAILPLLNGLGHLDRLTARFGTAHVIGGMANISAGVDAEGRITSLFRFTTSSTEKSPAASVGGPARWRPVSTVPVSTPAPATS
jgi:ketopantoate reductase